MENKFDYLKLRDKLNSKLKGIPGVLSVGLTSKNGETVLLVAIDSEELKSKLPDKFKSIDIVLKDLGKAKKYVYGGEFESKY